MNEVLEKHLFVPGARVAIRDKHGDGYREAFVDKVYKNGNFTLRSQQWRPWRPGAHDDGRWCAHETGERGWNGGMPSGSGMERIRPSEMTDAMLAAIEAALSLAKETSQ